MKLSGRSIAAVATALLLGLTGCGAAGQPGGTAPAGDRLAVTVAFYPLQYLVTEIAGEHAEVTSLTVPGSEPHDLELTPRQVGSLGDADLIVYQKGFQAAVDDAVAQSGTADALDVTTVVPPRSTGAEEDHDHEGEEHEGEEHEEHDHGGEAGVDPHLWLDPENMITMAGAVAEQLKRVDPDHAGDYDTNLAALTTDLTAIDTEFRDGLATCARREFIVSHAAFGYLAQRYDLTQIGISGLDPEAEPSPARIAQVQAEVRTHDVTTIFYETLVSPAVAQSIADDLKLKTDVLDPLEGITDQSRGRDYAEVMRANLTALRTANECR